MKMKIPPEKVISLHLGVDPSDYQAVDISTKKRNIGFLSRMSYENGFDILVDAFIVLKKSKEFDDVKLVLTGGSTGDDTKFLKDITKKLKRLNFYKDIDFCEDFESEGRDAFFRNISVLSVPVRQGEAFGMYLLEAMASGVPVIQPALGAFPEIIELSGGGITYEPNTPEILAESLAKILNDKELLLAKSRDGYQGVLKHFDIKNQADKLVAFYAKIIHSTKVIYY
jgi:glycosyltransferase involved in cell wall biosynthesis